MAVVCLFVVSLLGLITVWYANKSCVYLSVWHDVFIPTHTLTWLSQPTWLKSYPQTVPFVWWEHRDLLLADCKCAEHPLELKMATLRSPHRSNLISQSLCLLISTRVPSPIWYAPLTLVLSEFGFFSFYLHIHMRSCNTVFCVCPSPVSYGSMHVFTDGGIFSFLWASNTALSVRARAYTQHSLLSIRLSTDTGSFCLLVVRSNADCGRAEISSRDWFHSPWV